MANAAKRTQTIIARRQDLIQGAIKSIANLGYGDSTVQTICEAAGLSRGLIGHYFKGKDDLLIEAFRHLCARSDEATRQAFRAVGDDPLQRLLAATATTFRSAASRDNALVWLAFCGVAPWNKSMTELHNRLYRRYRIWIQQMMEQAAEERGITIDAKRAALTYARMVDGFWMGWLMDRDAYSLDEATACVSDWVLELFGEKASATRKHATKKAGGASITVQRSETSRAAVAAKSRKKPARK